MIVLFVFLASIIEGAVLLDINIRLDIFFLQVETRHPSLCTVARFADQVSIGLSEESTSSISTLPWIILVLMSLVQEISTSVVEIFHTRVRNASIITFFGHINHIATAAVLVSNKNLGEQCIGLCSIVF